MMKFEDGNTKEDPFDKFSKSFVNEHTGKDEEVNIKDELSPVL